MTRYKKCPIDFLEKEELALVVVDLMEVNDNFLRITPFVIHLFDGKIPEMFFHLKEEDERDGNPG